MFGLVWLARFPQIAALESISIVITFYNETHLKKMLIQRLKQMFSSQQPDPNVSNRFGQFALFYARVRSSDSPCVYLYYPLAKRQSPSPTAYWPAIVTYRSPITYRSGP